MKRTLFTKGVESTGGAEKMTLSCPKSKNVLGKKCPVLEQGKIAQDIFSSGPIS